jgi:ribosomal protein L30E
MYEDEIKKVLTSKKLVLGKDEVLKNIRKGLMSKVFIASNCPEMLLNDLQKYSKMSGFELLETKVPNDELGSVCKKPFSIVVLGLLK